MKTIKKQIVFFIMICAALYVNAQIPYPEAVSAAAASELCDYLTARGINAELQCPEQYSVFTANVYAEIPPAADENARIFIAAPMESGKALIDAVVWIMSEFKNNPLENARVCAVFTGGDYSVLPENLREGIPAGTNYLASSIAEDTVPAAVIILEEETGSGVRAVNSADRRTGPIWLLEAIIDAFDGRTPIKLIENRMEIYRFGWVPADPLIQKYIENNIAAISLRAGTQLLENEKTRQTFASCLTDAIKTLEHTIKEDWDEHYLVFAFADKTHILAEEIIVRIVFAACAIILFGIFMLWFTAGKNRAQRRSDFKKSAWLIPFYYGVTCLALFISKTIILNMFDYRLGAASGWTLAPRFSLAYKTLLTLTIICAAATLEQLFYLPRDSFVYGFAAGLACFADILVFSSVHFSLSISFLWAYCCCFVFYHCRGFLTSLFWAIAMLIPFFCLWRFFRDSRPDAEAARVFFISGSGNFLTSAFLLPFELTVVRLRAIFVNPGKGARFRLPITFFLCVIASVAAASYFFTADFFTPERPLPLYAEETVLGDTSELRIISPYKTPDLSVAGGGSEYTIGDPEESSEGIVYTARIRGPGRLFSADISTSDFLDRTTTKITIASLAPEASALRYEIIAENPAAQAVYDASIPYSSRNGGRVCRFMPGELPPEVFSFEFASKKGESPNLTIVGLFNPANRDVTISGGVPTAVTYTIKEIQTFAAYSDAAP